MTYYYNVCSSLLGIFLSSGGVNSGVSDPEVFQYNLATLTVSLKLYRFQVWTMSN